MKIIKREDIKGLPYKIECNYLPIAYDYYTGIKIFLKNGAKFIQYLGGRAFILKYNINSYCVEIIGKVDNQ